MRPKVALTIVPHDLRVDYQKHKVVLRRNGRRSYLLITSLERPIKEMDRSEILLLTGETNNSNNPLTFRTPT